MTLRTQLEGILRKYGISENESSRIIDFSITEIKQDPDYESVDFDKDNDISIIRAAYLSIKALIVKWIDANKPQAWYRSLFV